MRSSRLDVGDAGAVEAWSIRMAELAAREMSAVVEPHIQALVETSAEWRRVHGEPDG